MMSEVTHFDVDRVEKSLAVGLKYGRTDTMYLTG